jgi:hypothetical protein
MRRLLISFALVAFYSASSWANSILDVNASATFTATKSCSSNCTETISTSFQYLQPSILDPFGEIVPGTLDVSASGFLGSFSKGGAGSFYYVPFLDSLGDEIDLDIPGSRGIRAGVDTVDFYLFSCQSMACDKAFGERWIVLGPGSPTSQWSTATPVGVPDETSFLSLMLAALGSTGLVWRWRKREAMTA